MERYNTRRNRDRKHVGVRRGLVLLAAACAIHLTACIRVSVLPRPPAGNVSAALSSAEQATAAMPTAPADVVTSVTAVPTARPLFVARPAVVLTTATPLPRPTPSPTPTIAPPTPVIPRAETPPTELSIPAIGLTAPIVPMGWQTEPNGDVLWEDPGSSVGWLESSSLPGEGSNVVLAGHHNIRGEVFRDLVDVALGDEVLLVAGGTTYRYLVRERFIIPEKHVSAEQKAQNALWIAPTIDERLTMLTCWPYRDNTHRLIVIAMPAPLDPSP